MNSPYNNKVGFAVGTGRCGTQFLSRVLALEKEVAAVHERNILNECFHRYCKWYELPVDDEGFLHTKENEIREDLKGHRFSFEASAPLSLSIEQLYQRFEAKFILLVRSPEKVVDSYLRKGYFEKPYICQDTTKALGFQECEKFHHFLGRIVPKGKEFESWNKMTRRGKITWFWNQVNVSILDQFSRLPKSHWMIQRLEELTHEQYLTITRFFDVEASVSKTQFESMIESRPNSLENVPTIHDWNKQEIEEFERIVAPMAVKFGYAHSIEDLKRTSKVAV